MARLLRIGAPVLLLLLVMFCCFFLLDAKAVQNRRARALSLQLVARSLEGKPLSAVVATLGSPTRIEVTRGPVSDEQHRTTEQHGEGEESTLRLLYEYDVGIIPLRPEKIVVTVVVRPAILTVRGAWADQTFR